MTTALSKWDWLDGIRVMRQIRRFDERALDLRLEDRIYGPVHPYVGQEAIAAGVCGVLRPEDRIVSHHRGHGHTLAKGAEPWRMFAELFGSADGYCGGKGGSMHIADASIGMLGANGIVGAGAAIAVGSALAARLRGEDVVTVCFFGDGATGQGQVFEAMNLASVWRLPVLFVCENNGYAVDNPISTTLGAKSVTEIAASVGIAGRRIDGNDYGAVRTVAAEVVDQVRAGGPQLLECLTFRVGVHAQRKAPIAERRDTSLVEQWRERDPIVVAERASGADPAELQRIADEVDTEMEAAIERAAAAPAPDPATAFEHVTSPATPAPKLSGEPHEATTQEAFIEAIAEALRSDPDVFFMSTELPAPLAAEFGPERVRATPISEAAMVGAAVGAAMCGTRPVLWLRNATFAFVAFDQIINQAAKLRYMFGGQYQFPLTIWMNGGAGTQAAAQHSQVPYALYAHVPGLRVVAPSNPTDAYALTRTAIASDDPVIVLGSYRDLPRRGTVDPSAAITALGAARIARPGRDVTIVAAASMVGSALEAAASAQEEGISAEVVDLRWIAPLDTELVRESVRRTGRLLVVDEAPAACSVSAQVAAEVTEDRETFAALTAPVARVTGAHVPVPYSPALESAVVPSVDAVLDALRAVMSVEASA